MPNDRIIVDPDLGDDLGYRPVGQAPKGNNHFNDEVITLHSQLLMPAIPKSYFNQQTFKSQGFNLKDPQVDQIQRLINARRPNAKPLVIDGDYGLLTQTALNQCACVECPSPTGGPDKATLYSLLKGEVSGQEKSVQTEDLTTANLPVWSLTLEEKFVQTLHLVISKLPMELENAVKDMLSPAAIAMIAGVMVIWAGSHVFGVGFAVDAIMLVSGVVFLGLEVWEIADDFGDYLSKTAAAETQAQLDEASNHLARIIVVLGVEVFMVVIAKASGRIAGAARKEAEVQLEPQDRKTDGLDEVEADAVKVDVDDGVVYDARVESVVLDGFKNVPSAEYSALSVRSEHNPNSDVLVLGKYDPVNVEGKTVPGPSSYITKAEAEGATYFDMGAEWNATTDKYSLTDDDMFEAFNIPVLDKAVSSGKTIKFTHNPREYGGFLEQEWDYLQHSHGYFDLEKIDGVWHAVK